MEKYIKSFIKKFLVGMCIGVFINQIIILLVTYGIGGEQSSIPLVFLVRQFVVSAIGGGIIVGISGIYDIEKISILTKTTIHVVIALICYIGMAILGDWFNGNTKALVLNIAFFIAFYIVVWVLKYFSGKRRVDEINNMIRKKV